jgi:hypothetical protein
MFLPAQATISLGRYVTNRYILQDKNRQFQQLLTIRCIENQRLVSLKMLACFVLRY